MRPNYACKRCLSLSFRYTNIYIIYADLWRDKGVERGRERGKARASHHLSAASLIYLHFCISAEMIGAQVGELFS